MCIRIDIEAKQLYYYNYFKRILTGKNIDLNTTEFTDFKEVIPNEYYDIHEKFLDFSRKLIYCSSNDKKLEQTNNHFFLRSLIEERKGVYNHIYLINAFCINKREKLTYDNLYQKNVAGKEIFSNRIISNETEERLKVRELEEFFLKFTRDENQKNLKKYPSTRNFIVESELDSDKEEKLIKYIQDYICLQIIRTERHFLELIKLFDKRLNIEVHNYSLFDYLFFKYLYNFLIVEYFNRMKNEVISFNYVLQKNYNRYLTIDKTLPDNFCLNENNTCRISDLKNGEGYEVFSSDERARLNDIFITVATSNSFLYLSKEKISKDLFQKIDNYIRNNWDIHCVKFSFRSVLIPKNMDFIDTTSSTYILEDPDPKNSLLEDLRKKFASPEFENSLLLDELFKKSDEFEKKLKDTKNSKSCPP